MKELEVYEKALELAIKKIPMNVSKYGNMKTINDVKIMRELIKEELLNQAQKELKGGDNEKI